MDLRTRMANCFTEVRVKTSIYFILKPRELQMKIKANQLQSPSRPGDSLSGCGAGRFN
jgi:hypothetical protein